MSFHPCHCLLKIQESIGSPTPKMGVHLGVWGFIPSHSLTLSKTWNVIFEHHFWPAPLQTLVLVTSPKLGLQHYKSNCQKDSNLLEKKIWRIKWHPIEWLNTSLKKYLHEIIVWRWNGVFLNFQSWRSHNLTISKLPFANLKQMMFFMKPP
jgi:hypothetical protein